MEMLIAALAASALTAMVTVAIMIRRARSQRVQLEQQLHVLKERMQRAGATLAAADVYAFEIPVGLNRVQPSLYVGDVALAAVDFLSNPGEFIARVHPDDADRLEDVLKTLTLRDGLRHFEYRFNAYGSHSSVRAVTRLVRDELGRPIVVSGVMFGSTADDTDQSAGAAPAESHEEPAASVSAAPRSSDTEWQSFVADQAISNAVEGEYIELDSRRVQRAR